MEMTKSEQIRASLQKSFQSGTSAKASTICYGYSLTVQEQYYEEQINANPNWQFAEIYSDVGSGTTIKGRKRLNAPI